MAITHKAKYARDSKEREERINRALDSQRLADDLKRKSGVTQPLPGESFAETQRRVARGPYARHPDKAPKEPFSGNAPSGEHNG